MKTSRLLTLLIPWLALHLSMTDGRSQNVDEDFDFAIEGVSEGGLGTGSWQVFSFGENAGAAIRSNPVERDLTNLVLTNRLLAENDASAGWIFCGVPMADPPAGPVSWESLFRATNITLQGSANELGPPHAPMAGVVLTATSPNVGNEGEGLFLALAPGRTLALIRYSGGLAGACDVLGESFDLVDRATIGNTLLLRVVFDPTTKNWKIFGHNFDNQLFFQEATPEPALLLEVRLDFPVSAGSWWTGVYAHSDSSAAQLLVKRFQVGISR